VRIILNVFYEVVTNEESLGPEQRILYILINEDYLRRTLYYYYMS